MTTRDALRELAHRIRVLQQLDNGGRDDRDHDAAIIHAADMAVAHCRVLGEAIRTDYPHSDTSDARV
jgi:hypothetical protein